MIDNSCDEDHHDRDDDDHVDEDHFLPPRFG